MSEPITIITEPLITDWLTSFGTISAVGISLFLILKDNLKKAIITINTSSERVVKNNKCTKKKVHKVCFYNKSKKNIHLRKVMAYRSTWLPFRKYKYFDFESESEFNHTVKFDEFIEVNIDLERDNEIWRSLGLDVNRLKQTIIIFEDITGKRYRKKFKLSS